LTAVNIQVAVPCVTTPCGRIPSFRRTLVAASSGWN